MTSRVLASSLAVAGLCLLPALVKLACYPSYPGSDDAFIHLSIIENIHRGNAWGINNAAPVLMSTSPLFTGAFALVRQATPHVLETGMLLSALAGILYVLGIYRLTHRLTGGHPAWSLLGAAFAATNIHFWRWNGTFMEVTFAMTAVTWLIAGFLAACRDNGRTRQVEFILLGTGLAAGMFLRPEIGLLIPAFLIHGLLGNRRRLFPDLASMTLGFIIVFLPALLVLKHYFGYVTPTALQAKLSPSLLWINLRVWVQLLGATGTGCLGSALAITIAALLMLFRRSPSGTWRQSLVSTAALWCFPLLGFCFYALKMPVLQSTARYFLPFMAAIPAMAAAVLPATLPAGRRVITIAALCLLVQIAFASAWNVLRVQPVLNRMIPGYVHTMRNAANAILANARPGNAVLAFQDIGVLSATLATRVRILDGGGLASPELQGLSLPDMVRTGRPRFVVESLGSDDHFVQRTLEADGIGVSLVWQERFPSHSIEFANQMFETRLFEIKASP